ncbi:MAG: hypothetical protein CVT92_00525 [Bacteroidetes bacterium HGW-Bacteroidetes-1]|jgi:hypothetical protein|nr:MAG: hypothetical protein CVT92_00525 [Bacteroidetes bacterium HGW-Bacteroidetes-1]
MKRFFIALVIVFNTLMAFSGEIQHTYYFTGPDVSRHGEYDLLNMNNTMLTNRVGEPLLPYQAVSLLLPPGHKAVWIEVLRENEVKLTGSFNIMPAQPSRPLSEKKRSDFMKNEDIYTSSKPYPSSSFGQLTTQTMNGHSFAFSSFTPFEYIPVTGEVKYFAKVTVILHTGADPNAEASASMLYSDKKISSRVERLAQNPEALQLYAGKSKNSEDYELLIITPQMYESGFADLVSMCKSRGMRTMIKSIEFIASNLNGVDLQEKIRNFIIQEYQTHAIETVLIGGDVELVPYRGFYCYVQSGSGYTDTGIPADLYYSALDGNWNTDNDNKWGEPGEDDLLPEVAVGRFPFSNATELANLIHKSISYQNQPVLGEFTKPLFVGENLYNNPITWGSDYLELLIGDRSDNGYTTYGIPSGYSFQKLYEEDYNWSKNDLINAIGQGKQFVHHVGHSSQTYVAKMSNSDITNANFSQNNGIIRNYSILQTHGCDCGAFDYNDCILEKMVNIENFAVAVIGNSRYGWFNEGQTEGPAAHLHREMTDALFHEKINFLGSAMVEGKAMTAPWVTAPGQWEEGALRWNFYDLNLLGDPALSVWTAEPVQPQVSYQPEIVLGAPGTQVTVSLNGFPAVNFVCSVMKNEEIIAVAQTNQTGLAELVFDPPIVEIGAATLQVVGYNALPESFDLMVIPNEGPYVVYESNAIDDTNGGNGNGLADYGETINLNMQIKNVGMALAQNVSAQLTSTSSFVTILNGTTTISELPAGASVSLDNAFSFEINPEIPNQELVNFILTCSNGDQIWTSSFNIPLYAPEMVVSDLTINDLISGNGNGMLDPGETVSLSIVATNAGGSTAYAVIASLYSSSSYVLISQTQQFLEEMIPGESKTAVFELSVSADAPYGTVVDFNFQVEAPSGYEDSKQFFLPVGLRIESFESGDFNAYEWHHGGNANWTLNMEQPFEGTYCVKSGAIGHDFQSDLWISLIVFADDEISFARKVSSEANYDYLKFFVDDNLIDQWSGEMGWQELSYPVSSGSHILRWSYTKDMSVSTGSDCAWIDKITFPGTTMVIDLGERLAPFNVSVFPNPNAGRFVIASCDNKPIHMRMIDIAGKLVLEDVLLPKRSIVNADHLQAGMYILEVFDEHTTFRTKIIIEK